MTIAHAHDCGSIAFPAISTGVYRFPPQRAATIAATTSTEFLRETLSIRRLILLLLFAKRAPSFTNGVLAQI